MSWFNLYYSITSVKKVVRLAWLQYTTIAYPGFPGRSCLTLLILNEPLFKFRCLPGCGIRRKQILKFEMLPLSFFCFLFVFLFFFHFLWVIATPYGWKYFHFIEVTLYVTISLKMTSFGRWCTMEKKSEVQKHTCRKLLFPVQKTTPRSYWHLFQK